MSHLNLESHPTPPPIVDSAGKPDNSLVWAILATLCCCVPTGIVAIVFAAQVDGKWDAGDHAGAEHAAEQARIWSWVSLGLGLASLVIYLLLGMAGALEG